MTCTTTIRRGSRNLLLLVVWLSFVSPFAGVARAAVDLIAVGSISGTYEDFATETAAPLENGIPGIGSAEWARAWPMRAGTPSSRCPTADRTRNPTTVPWTIRHLISPAFTR